MASKMHRRDNTARVTIDERGLVATVKEVRGEDDA